MATHNHDPGTNTGQEFGVSYRYDAVDLALTEPFFIASRRYVVTAIIGRVLAQGSGGACTLSFYRAPSGTAIGSGTILHSGSYNVVGTIDANQTLSLASASSLEVANGDVIGAVLTGTPTAGSGAITITLRPN